MDHTQLVRSITRYARTVREPSLVLQELDEAISRAFGEGGEPGPSYIDFPTDTLRGIVPKALQLEEHLSAKPRAVTRPDPDQRRRGGRPPVVGAPRAGDFRTRCPRRRTRADLAARPARRRLSRHRRKPWPGAGQPSFRRRRHARRGDERCRRGPDGRPPSRLPARLRLAGRIRQRQSSCASAIRLRKCATTGAAPSRSWPLRPKPCAPWSSTPATAASRCRPAMGAKAAQRP